MKITTQKPLPAILLNSFEKSNWQPDARKRKFRPPVVQDRGDGMGCGKRR